jgi:hypothetical protein
MQSNGMKYTPAMLARLAYSDGAHELSERLVSEVGTYSDAYGRGAFLAEEAVTIVSEANALLEGAVVADRLRGVSWSTVAEALDVSAEAAQERFSPSEQRFREALLFPHRYPANGGLGHSVAPYAVEEPDRVRERLDARVVRHRSSGRPNHDEPEPVTRGLTAMAGSWIAERVSQVVELSDALMKRQLPDGVRYQDAVLRHARLMVELYEAMAAERPGSGGSSSSSLMPGSASASCASAARRIKPERHGLRWFARTVCCCASRLQPVRPVGGGVSRGRGDW